MSAFEIHDITSEALGVKRRITVWLPPGYRSRGRTPYPVLYLNDGQNLFDASRAFGGVTWRVAETATHLVRRRRIPPLVIVGIDHGGVDRAREYLPVEDDRNPLAQGPLGRAYATFVTRELMPTIARQYAIGRGASATGFGGSSYGAVAALFTALERPGTFGRLLLESPSLYVGHGYLLRRALTAHRWPQRVYLGVGTAEVPNRAWSEQAVADVRRLESTLRRAGLGPRRLRVHIEDGATHSEHAWASRLPQAVRFLFGW